MQRFLIFPWPPGLSHYQHPPPMWHICYDQWICTDTSYSPQGSFFTSHVINTCPCCYAITMIVSDGCLTSVEGSILACGGGHRLLLEFRTQLRTNTWDMRTSQEFYFLGRVLERNFSKVSVIPSDDKKERELSSSKFLHSNFLLGVLSTRWHSILLYGSIITCFLQTRKQKLREKIIWVSWTSDNMVKIQI